MSEDGIRDVRGRLVRLDDLLAAGSDRSYRESTERLARSTESLRREVEQRSAAINGATAPRKPGAA